MTKKSDEKSAKKGGGQAGLTVPKDGATKSATGKEARAGSDKQKKIIFIRFKIF
jgi:hypothetical protein